MENQTRAISASKMCECRSPSRRGRGADSRIEIALPDGAVVRVGSAVDQWALVRVLAALRGTQ